MAANRRLKHRASRQPSPLECIFRELLLSTVTDDGRVQGTKRISYGREKGYGILIRPATVLPVEIYSPERRAEFLLNNAVDAEGYRQARAAVKRMGLDPDRTSHSKPTKMRG